GAGADYLAASRELVRLSPDNPTALAYRGDARLRTGDRPGGRDDLRAALELQPSNSLAGMLLFDDLLASGDLDEAGPVLAWLKKDGGRDYSLARAVQLLVKRNEAEPAAEAFRQLCLSTNEATWPLDSASAALRDAGWGARVDSVFREVLREPAFHPHAAILW